MAREYRIGTGGWGYFRVPRVAPLAAYARMFDFVEVNSTFYHVPPLKKVEVWRRHVPDEFEFSVRAHQSITHRYALKPVEEMFEMLERMRQICRVLRAEILHLQLPPSFKPTKSSTDLQTFLSSTSFQNPRLALEFRSGLPIPSELVKTMRDHNVVHCTDLSRGETPAYESDILYSRLFGRGEHNIYQPTDKELVFIDRKASESKSHKVVLSFHFVRMYKDAARLKVYKETGKFPMITQSTGLDSFKKVLSEDARFPSTKQELIKDQGWKVFDLSENERINVADFLDKLPEATYNDVHEVTDTLKNLLR